MRPVTAILITVSLVAAGGAGMLAKRVVDSRAKQAAAALAERQRDVEVLVAARDLQQGKALKNDDLKWVPWPIATAEAAKVVVRLGGQEPLQHLQGSVLKRNVVAGEPMSDALVFTPGHGALMPGLLTPGTRAIGITVSAQASASGFVLPGDRVDVVATIKFEKDPDNKHAVRYATLTVATNVRVLAVDQDLGAAGSAPKATKKKKKKEEKPAEGEVAPDEVAMVGKTVAVEVSPEEAERILNLQSFAKLALALRSMAEGTETVPRKIPFVTDRDHLEGESNGGQSGVKIIRAGGGK